MEIFLVLVGLLVLVGAWLLVGCLFDGKEKKAQRPYNMGAANVNPGNFRKSKNW